MDRIISNAEAKKRIVNSQTRHLINQITTGIRDEDFSKNLINCFNAVLDLNEEELIFSRETVVLIFAAEKLLSDPGYTYLGEMIEELKRKIVRKWILGGSVTLQKCAEALEKKDDVERFIPHNGDFRLPKEGEMGNLDVKEFDENGKPYIRHVLIDSEGYLVKEMGRDYEMAEDATFNDFHPDLKKAVELKKETETIKEAKKVCEEGDGVNE